MTSHSRTNHSWTHVLDCLSTLCPTPTFHGEDRTWNIRISRFAGFPSVLLRWRGLQLPTWNPVWNFGDSQGNVFDMYGDSCENLLQILAIVIVLSPISCASDLSCLGCAYKWHVSITNRPFTNSCVGLCIINVADTHSSCLGCSYKWHFSVTNQPFTNPCVRLLINYVSET